MKPYRDGKAVYKQAVALTKIYDISRSTVARLLDEMRKMPKYKQSFLVLSPTLRLVRLADFDRFLKEKSSQFLRK